MSDTATEFTEVDEAPEVAEDEVAQPTEAATEAPVKATKHKLPQGIATPIEALNVLKQKKLVPQDFAPQRMYGFVKNPGKTEPFPVKHYDAEGNVFDEAQLDASGHPTTRPGVITEEVIVWWKGKGERDKDKAEKRAAAAAAKAEKEKAAAAQAQAAATEAPPAAEEGAVEEVEAE